MTSDRERRIRDEAAALHAEHAIPTLLASLDHEREDWQRGREVLEAALQRAIDRASRAETAGREMVRATDQRDEAAERVRLARLPAQSQAEFDRARSLHALACQAYYEARADLLVALMMPPNAK
jgi:hypothetical protein